MSAGDARGGHLLLLVAVIGVLAMAAWGAAYRATGQAVRCEGFHLRRERRAETVQPALAAGIALLRTGDPPLDPYACVVAVTTGAATEHCTVTFAGGSSGLWTVTAEQSTDEEVETLPPAPPSFE